MAAKEAEHLLAHVFFAHKHVQWSILGAASNTCITTEVHTNLLPDEKDFGV